MNVNDFKFQALVSSGIGQATIPDMWKEWLVGETPGSSMDWAISHLEYMFLGSKGRTELALNDRWYGYLGSLGYSQLALPDRFYAWFFDSKDTGLTSDFVAISAAVDWQAPDKLIITLNANYDSGSLSTGIAITSNINGAQLISGAANLNTLTYTLDQSAVEGEVITWSATSSLIVDGDARALQDSVLVASNNIDSTVPTLQTATIHADGNNINLFFDESVFSPGGDGTLGWTLTGGSVGTIAFDSFTDLPGEGTVQAHLTGQVKIGETILLQYDGDTAGDVADAQGNKLSTIQNFATTNNSTQDPVPVDPPELIGAVVMDNTPSQVDLTFSENVLGTVLGWEVLINGTPATSLALVGGADTRSLTFAELVAQGDTVLVNYVEATGDMTDTAGLPLPDYTNFPVSNGVATPIMTSASVQEANRSQLILGFSEVMVGTLGWSATINGGAVSNGVISGSGSPLFFTFDEDVLASDTVLVSYTPGDMADVGGTPLAAIVNAVVVNQVTTDKPAFIGPNIPDQFWTYDVAITPIDTAILFTGTQPRTYEKVGVWPSGVDVDLNTGIISGTPVSETPPVWESVVTTLNIVANVPMTPYSYSQHVSGSQPITYTLAAGTLPAGLSLSTSGVLSGTPTNLAGETQAGIVITATNAFGTDDSTAHSIVSAEAAPIFDGIVAQMNLIQDALMTPYDYSTHFTTGGAVDSYAVISGTLPAGLSLDTGTGILSGTPTTVEAQAIVIGATNTTATVPTNSHTVAVTAFVSVDPPLDTFTGAAYAFSASRLLRTAYVGDCMRVRRSNDDAELDIGFDGNGDLDQVALLAHCGANSGFVMTLYDQSGNGRNITGITDAQEPRIVNAGVVDLLNGKPAMDFDGTDDVLELAGQALNTVLGAALETTIAGVSLARNLAAESTLVGLRGGGGASAQWSLVPSGPGSYLLNAGNTTGRRLTATIPVGYQDRQNIDTAYTNGSTAGTVRNNGVEFGTSSSWTNSANTGDLGPFDIGANLSVFGPFDGQIQEVIVYNTDTHLTTALEDALNDYYGAY